jgi:2'-5' RNA ligase
LAAVLGDLPADVRPVPPHQWHVTLAFYGEVPDGKVPALTDRLTRAASRTPSFELALTGAGVFPGQPRQARQIWVGLDGDVAVLTRLAERCVAAGRRESIPIEERAFRPHLTLGRARKQTVDATDLVGRLSGYGSATWSVRSFTLVRSTLGASVRHGPLVELPLGA